MKKTYWNQALKIASGEMPKYEQELCVLDTEVGDGDHGVTIARGFRSVAEDPMLNEEMEPNAFCEQFANTLSANMGGAIGPIYGLFWKEMGKALKDCDEITSKDIARGMQGAIARIMRVCHVGPGDKTVLDAMLPCAEAMQNNEMLPISEMMSKAIEGAEMGRDATRDMVAQKGRARFLFEKTLGHVDAGACSFTLCMKEWKKSMDRYA